jgi:YegS/Rv2252/BmrU family lipid kinase
MREFPVIHKKRKILFIVNPNAGRRIAGKLIQMIGGAMPAGTDYRIEVWKDKDNFRDITAMLMNDGYTEAIAVGGDGTVNHVAKTILNTNIALGIIPAGSGNGLARTLGISMNIGEALKQIAAGRKIAIDSGSVNGIPFFCTSGAGFDAEVGIHFSRSLKRGLQSYVRIILREILRYKAKNYTIALNGISFQRKAFLITVANAGQYGNDFYIAPQASLQDGLFHVVILKPFNALTVAGLLAKILLRRAHLSRNVETFITERVTISREAEAAIHFDGDPTMAGRELTFEMHRASLRVIVSEKFKAS